MSVRHLERLRQARDLLHLKGLDTGDTVAALYSGVGFDAALRSHAADDPRVLLVDLNVIYGEL